METTTNREGNMTTKYRITWNFQNGTSLVRLVHFNSIESARRAMDTDPNGANGSFVRDIFRRAGLFTVGGTYEWQDSFPVPTSVEIEVGA